MFERGAYRGLALAGTISGALAFAVFTTTIFGTENNPGSLLVTVTVTGAVIGVALTPLYEPRPRRVTDLFASTVTRVGIACLTISAIGFFALFAGSHLGTSLPLTPASVVVLFLGLSAVLPAWYWFVDRYTNGQRAVVVVVGNEPSRIATVTRELPVTPIGFLSPSPRIRGLGLDGRIDESSRTEPNRRAVNDRAERGAVDDKTERGDSSPALSDGGFSLPNRDPSIDALPRLGGLSRLEDVLCRHDVDTVALAFRHADRAECFGVLQTCHDLGIDVYAHESLEDRILVDEEIDGGFVRVDLEPWSWYCRVCKRTFDVAFATVAILATLPLVAVIALLIKIGSPGPVFYKQVRTSELGDTFTILKFRTMYTDSEKADPLRDDDNDDITPIGRFLRKTHLDEIPQLTSILCGHMSVVGPRAAWIREEVEVLDPEVPGWSKRWYVKPGLTGLAQIQDATSVEGEQKLEFDLEYVRTQSFWLDLRIVAAQIWIVLVDVARTIRP